MTHGEDRAKTIEDISTRLTQKHPTVQPAAIAHAVEQAYAEYDGRPIRDFLPVLVERSVSEKLRT